VSEFEGGIRTETRNRSGFADGATAGAGSLPHLDPVAAAAFSIGEFDVATIPTTPRRSHHESMLAQALVGVRGVQVGPDGTIAVDPMDVKPHASVVTDLDHEAFTGVRSFLDLAGKVHLDGAAVKWQFVGPVTLGVGLHRAGLDRETAFEFALEIVRDRVAAIADVIRASLPNSKQMVVLDEPWFSELMRPGFPIPPDEAIDRMSGAMAALPADTLTGVHCCAPCDVATLLASGPNVVSLPVAPELVDWVGYLTRFLADGGIVAWGVVPTDGPVGSISERQWRALSDLWCGLVQRGCDPVLLRRQSLVTPQCGLAMHSVSAARRIARLTAEVGKRVQDQSAATRFALGA
jgi:methionine synthase II (cobalamin-independent)